MVVASRIQHKATCGFLQGTLWENTLLGLIQAKEERVEDGAGRDEVVREAQVIPDPPLMEGVASGGD